MGSQKQNTSSLGAKRLWVLSQIQRCGVFDLTKYPSYRKAVAKLVDAGLVEYQSGQGGDKDGPYVCYATRLGLLTIAQTLQPFEGILFEPYLTYVRKKGEDKGPLYFLRHCEEVGKVRLIDPLDSDLLADSKGDVVDIMDLNIVAYEDIRDWLAVNKAA